MYPDGGNKCNCSVHTSEHADSNNTACDLNSTVALSGSNPGQDTDILYDDCSGFAQFRKTNAGTILQIRLPPLPSTSFLIHYSRIIHPFDAMYSRYSVGWGETVWYVGHYWPIVPAPDNGLIWSS
jgi:hypothetical protein